MIDNLNKILDKFKGKKVMVIGDIMLDRYIWGSVSRISPEAPVQVVNVKKEQHIPGGAGNTANNVSALGGNVSLVGLIGNDNAGKILIAELRKRNVGIGGIIVDKGRPTIQKVRVMGQNQQLLRIDYEDSSDMGEQMKDMLFDFVAKNIEQTEIIVFTDYAKGVFTKNSIRELIDLAREHNKRVIVDPKPKNALHYAGVDLITPNNKEACEICGVEASNDEHVIDLGNRMVKDLNANILITRGEKGMSLFTKKGNFVRVTNIPTTAKEVYDVSGAGDTVVAAMALALASNAPYQEAALIANIAAGVVVGKLGVATASIEEIKENLK